jgi:hypothetical protein
VVRAKPNSCVIESANLTATLSGGGNEPAPNADG